jgi:hypothetical protein
MNARFITVEEHAVLQELETAGPGHNLNARVRGRLALYGMIDEGPRGWSITPAGHRMLKYGPVAPRSPQDLMLSLRPVLATAENMAWTDPEEAERKAA